MTFKESYKFFDDLTADYKKNKRLYDALQKAVIVIDALREENKRLKAELDKYTDCKKEEVIT